MTVWTVKGGRHGEREQRLLENGILGGGWSQLPSLEGIESKEELAELYRECYPDVGAQTLSNYVGQLWSLVHRMAVGDLVVLPLKTTGTVAVGRIAGPYLFRDDLGEDLRHLRPVEWIRDDVARDAFDQDLLYSFGAFLTFGRVRRENAEQRILRSIGSVAHAKPQDGAGADESSIQLEETPDIDSLAKEQVRQLVGQTFAGHELTRLVAAILAAQGFTVNISPPGADRGIDILGGTGPIGLDSPRLVAQVKTGQAGIDDLRSLRGLLDHLRADQGLLVAWNGFKGTVRAEARSEYFKLKLWDAEDVLQNLFDNYERLGDEIRSELPLQRIWTRVMPPQ